MPTRAPVGNPDGVTNASVAPATTRQSIAPSITTADRMPVAEIASARDRSPGAMIAHPIAMPAPAPRKIELSSNKPWGMMSPQNSDPLPADRQTVLEQQDPRPEHQHRTRSERQRRDLDVVGEQLEGPRLGGLARVVVLEAAVRQDLLQLGIDRRVAHLGVVGEPCPGGDGRRQHDNGGEDHEPTRLPRGRGEDDGEERPQSVAGPTTRPVDEPPGKTEQLAQRVVERLVVEVGARCRQVGADHVVQFEQLVGLLRAQLRPPAPTRSSQRLQPLPLELVVSDELVDLHGAIVGGR